MARFTATPLPDGLRMHAPEPWPWGEILLCVTMVGCVIAAVLCEPRGLPAVIALDELFFGLLVLILVMMRAMLRVAPRVARREIVARGPRASGGYRDAPSERELIVDGRPVIDLRELVVRHAPANRNAPNRYLLYAVGAREVVLLDAWRSEREPALHAATALRAALDLPATHEPPLAINVDFLGLWGFALVGILLADVAVLIGTTIWITNVRASGRHALALHGGVGMATIAALSFVNYLAMLPIAARAARGWLADEFGLDR
jgi:hypothetical protein